MKYLAMGFGLCCLLSLSCDKDEANMMPANVTFNFSHHWDNTEVENSDFNAIQYTTENGEQLSVEKLRYLISAITFEKVNGDKMILEGYNLIDLGNGTNLSFTPSSTIPIGEYNKVSFTFGFNNEDNLDGAYTDLNSVLWNVPMMLGGGYHFMQLEGRFLDNLDIETGYQYHAIRAVDNSGVQLVFQDTFFEIDLGPVIVNNDIEFEISMNIAEWFKNPIPWDLNALHSMMMPNFDAQLMISQNGREAFNLEEIVQ